MQTILGVIFVPGFTDCFLTVPEIPLGFRIIPAIFAILRDSLRVLPLKLGNDLTVFIVPLRLNIVSIFLLFSALLETILFTVFSWKI